MSGPKPKEKERLGQTNTMKNDMQATIVRYRSSGDLDVQFEDGTYVYNKTYASFQKGLIGHPDKLHKSKIKDRTGETKLMSIGMRATITRYVSAKDIEVTFEDGAVKKKCAYKEFSRGNIAHPEYTPEAFAKKRLGETHQMNCGLMATITKYTSYHDVEVTFEDGEVVYPVDYGQFSDGSVGHPKLDGSMSLQEASVAYYFNRLGFQKMPKGSLKDMDFGNLELDLYNQERAIAIEIDGHFHKKENAHKRDAEKNEKCHKAGITLYRIREKDLPLLDDGLSINYILEGEFLYNGLLDCGGILREIIRTNNIEAPENFVDLKRDLDLILKFYFCHSVNRNRNDKIGNKVFHKATNQYMTIIDYQDWQHVTVMFDDGEIAYNKSHGAFKRGEIKHPKHTAAAKRLARLNETRRMRCGSNATIVAYRTSEDMDVKFENGHLKKGVTYYNFEKGNIKDS